MSSRNTKEPYAPEQMYSLGVQYTLAVGSLGSLIPRLDAQYQSSFFTDITDTPLGEVSGRTLMNAHLTWRSSKDDWEGTFAVTNLTDRFYYINKVNCWVAAHLHRTGTTGSTAPVVGHGAPELLRRLRRMVIAAAAPNSMEQFWVIHTGHMGTDERPTQHLPENRAKPPHRECLIDLPWRGIRSMGAPAAALLSNCAEHRPFRRRIPGERVPGRSWPHEQGDRGHRARARTNTWPTMIPKRSIRMLGEDATTPRQPTSRSVGDPPAR